MKHFINFPSLNFKCVHFDYNSNRNSGFFCHSPTIPSIFHYPDNQNPGRAQAVFVHSTQVSLLVQINTAASRIILLSSKYLNRTVVKEPARRQEDSGRFKTAIS